MKARPAPFPHRYEVSLGQASGSPAQLLSGERPVIAGGPPPEFGGGPERWSPEHLLLASASLCLTITLEALARRAMVTLARVDCRASGTLDKKADGIRFTALHLDVRVRSPDTDSGRVTELVHTAKKHCIVARTLAVPIGLDVSVEG